jgi:hypothetical protein
MYRSSMLGPVTFNRFALEARLAAATLRFDADQMILAAQPGAAAAAIGATAKTFGPRARFGP